MAKESTVRVSKELSFILRHGAERLGLAIDSAGFVRVDEILQRKAFQGVTKDTIREIVANCPKQRFSLREDGGDVLFIRANQGHSMQGVIDEHELLTPISAESAGEFPVVVHGTYLKSWELIKSSGGLSRMGRTHIHFAVGLPGDSGTISGMRSSAEVLAFINLQRALADGVPFFVSANRVVLCPGVADTGSLPLKYFQKVVSRKTGAILYPGAGSAQTNAASPMMVDSVDLKGPVSSVPSATPFAAALAASSPPRVAKHKESSKPSSSPGTSFHASQSSAKRSPAKSDGFSAASCGAIGTALDRALASARSPHPMSGRKDVGVPRNRDEIVPGEDGIVHERSCGAIVVRGTGKDTEVLLMKLTRGNRMDFPKGHVEAYDGSDLATALRELREEAGLEESMVEQIPGFVYETEYALRPKNDVQRDKRVVLFLFRLKDGFRDTPIICTEHDGYLWHPLSNFKSIERHVDEPLKQAAAFLNI